MRCKYVGEGRGWGSLGGREESTALGLGFIDNSSPHLLCGPLAFLAEIWAGVTRTLVSSGLIRVWQSPWIAGYHLIFSGITGPLNPCPPSGTEAGCHWMDSPHPAFARAPSLSSPGWHTGSKLSYFLISPLRELWTPRSQPYHSGSHRQPRGAQKSYTPSCLSAWLPPHGLWNGATWEVMSFYSPVQEQG